MVVNEKNPGFMRSQVAHSNVLNFVQIFLSFSSILDHWNHLVKIDAKNVLILVR